MVVHFFMSTVKLFRNWIDQDLGSILDWWYIFYILILFILYCFSGLYGYTFFEWALIWNIVQTLFFCGGKGRHFSKNGMISWDKINNPYWLTDMDMLTAVISIPVTHTHTLTHTNTHTHIYILLHGSVKLDPGASGACWSTDLRFKHSSLWRRYGDMLQISKLDWIPEPKGLVLQTR